MLLREMRASEFLRIRDTEASQMRAHLRMRSASREMRPIHASRTWFGERIHIQPTRRMCLWLDAIFCVDVHRQWLSDRHMAFLEMRVSPGCDFKTLAAAQFKRCARIRGCAHRSESSIILMAVWTGRNP
jgi:hypothetical protein